MADKTLYLKMDSRVKIKKEVICISDLGKLYCRDGHITNKVKPLKVHVFTPRDKGRCVISALMVTKLIDEACPGCTVDIVGETETIVEKITKQQSPSWLVAVKVSLVTLLCFFGTMYTIMAYHNDIDINRVFDQAHQLVLGKPSEGNSLLEISYSLGLSFGIILFYNHIGKRRLTPDPSPVEVEMRTYGDEINRALVEVANREEKTIDVS